MLRPLRPVSRVSRLKMLLYLRWSLSKVPGDNHLWNVTSFPRLLPFCPVSGRRPTPIRMQGTRVFGLCTSTLRKVTIGTQGPARVNFIMNPDGPFKKIIYLLVGVGEQRSKGASYQPHDMVKRESIPASSKTSIHAVVHWNT